MDDGQAETATKASSLPTKPTTKEADTSRAAEPLYRERRGRGATITAPFPLVLSTDLQVVYSIKYTEEKMFLVLQ